MIERQSQSAQLRLAEVAQCDRNFEFMAQQQ